MWKMNFSFWGVFALKLVFSSYGFCVHKFFIPGFNLIMATLSPATQPVQFHPNNLIGKRSQILCKTTTSGRVYTCPTKAVFIETKQTKPEPAHFTLPRKQAGIPLSSPALWGFHSIFHLKIAQETTAFLLLIVHAISKENTLCLVPWWTCTFPALALLDRRWSSTNRPSPYSGNSQKVGRDCWVELLQQ